MANFTSRVLAAIAPLLLSTPVFATDWALDPSFDFDGRVATAFDAGGNNFDSAARVLRYPSSQGGTYLAVGQVNLAGNTPAIGIIRYFPNGAIDTTFGSNGRVIKNACMTSITDAAFDSQFRIVVIGSTSCSGNATRDAAVVRFSANGADDLSFAGDGSLALKFNTDIGGDGNDVASALLVLPDDSLIVGGGYKGTGSEAPYIKKISVNGVPSTIPAFTPGFGSTDERFVEVVQVGTRSYWLTQQVFGASNAVGQLVAIDPVTATTIDAFGIAGRVAFSNVATSGYSSCGLVSNYRSTSLVPFGEGSDATLKVFGFTNAVPSRSFFVSVRQSDGGDYRAGCLDNGASVVDFSTVTAVTSPDGRTINLAGTRNTQMGFWRVSPNPSDPAALLRDPSFNLGAPIGIDFTAASGQPLISIAFSMLTQDRQVVLAGARVWNNSTSDFDFALARFGLNIFIDGFE